MDIRIAIFEDNKLVRDAYEAILNGTPGFRCTGSFSSCNNIRHDLQRSQPDVVLMDIEMTGMKGIEATGIIVKEFPLTKVLIQTVFDDDKRLFACICAGASGYILKDTAPVKLLEAIKEVNGGGASMSPGIAQKVLKLFQTMVPQAQLSQEGDDTHLSKREKEILQLMMEGYSFHKIAERCFISYDTVRTHVKNIYKKLHVASSSEAIVKAFRQHLI